MNPFEERGIPIERQIRSWKYVALPPYRKQDVDGFTRCRIYPAMRPASRRLDDAVAAHAHLRRIADKLGAGGGPTAETLRPVRQLKPSVLNHAAEEEAGVSMDAGHLGLAERRVTRERVLAA
jgi:hypothetical protein